MRPTVYLETSIISYLAARHGIDYLLTWNCAHIANAELRPHIDRACVARGYAPPVLCTPEELIGGQSNE